MLRLDDVMLCRLGLSGSDGGIHIWGFRILCTKVWLMCIPLVYIFSAFVYFVPWFCGFCIPQVAAAIRPKARNPEPGA